MENGVEATSSDLLTKRVLEVHKILVPRTSSAGAVPSAQLQVGHGGNRGRVRDPGVGRAIQKAIASVGYP
jgi:hypothetical protein